ncbi:MAG: arginine--tRNA ligase [Coprobacillus sp.]|nr:arginine--tRNA ligase [Coprobacillus sp.]
MEITLYLKEIIQKSLTLLGINAQLKDIVIEKSKNPSFGDYSTNVAMRFSKELGMPPVEVARKIISTLDKDQIEKAEIAGPGFINIFVKNTYLSEGIKTILEQDSKYGSGSDKHLKVNVEFVSANPTGDLHVGHARGAAVGDALARILSFDGYEVTKEYYINDAGSQIDNLALSILARYREILGLDSEIPEDGYHGYDIIVIARELYNEYGASLLERKNLLDFLKDEGIKREMVKINEDLEAYGVHFDVYTSERELRRHDSIPREIEYLRPYTYKSEGALYLATSKFVDDKDRVIVKSNGEYTYFLPDIVYHVDKLNRGNNLLIDVLGSDHHGYIPRLKSALMMHGYPESILECSMIQMVRFMKDGEEIVASKRTGNAITLRELIDEVGKDAARYYFVMRSGSVHFDFDLNLAVAQNSSNPVYYAQYAYARLCSVLELASKQGLAPSDKANLDNEDELNLLKELLCFPIEVEAAASERAPYRITNYIQSLAEQIHHFYTVCKIIDNKNLEATRNRLTLVKCAQIVMRNALNLIGVTPLEKM